MSILYYIYSYIRYILIYIYTHILIYICVCILSMVRDIKRGRKRKKVEDTAPSLRKPKLIKGMFSSKRKILSVMKCIVH